MDIPGENTDPGTTKAGPVTTAAPATETRGGRAVDWDAVQPGEPLPERDDPLEKSQLDEEA